MDICSYFYKFDGTNFMGFLLIQMEKIIINFSSNDLEII